MFQSTPPHGRRHVSSSKSTPMMLFQSTPPHGRRPERGDVARLWDTVSIHASAREATSEPKPEDDAPKNVSIHASAREATVTGVGLRG